VDLALLVLLTVLGIAARVVPRRPWVVEADASDGRQVLWRVVGWRDSGELADAAADALAHGISLPPGSESRTAAGAPPDA
jgi:hypothetical protein